MRTCKFSSKSIGTIAACLVAGMLTLHAGMVAAATKPVPPPKPAVPAPKPPPPRPGTPAGLPGTVPSRPVPPQPTRPGVQPTQPAQPGGLPARPGANLPGQPGVNSTRPGATRPGATLPGATLPGQPGVNPARPGSNIPGRPGAEPGRAANIPGRPNGTPNANIPGRPGSSISEPRKQSVIVPHDTRGNFNTHDVRGHVDTKTGRITHIEKISPDGSRTVVHNSPTGIRRVENVAKDPYGHEVRTVGDGHRGFRERELARRPGFRQRTYFDHGHAEVRVYRERTYVYGAYPVYVPAYYYHPGFYAYFGVAWGTPVAYNWGVYPGYDYYGGYFAPAPSYASPDAWLADYIIAQNLQAAYAAQQDAAADAVAAGQGDQIDPQTATPQPIPADVRQTYVQEVQASVQAVQAQAAGQPVPDDVPGALSPKFRVFQSYSDVEAIDANSQECALTGGDFVRREEDTPDSAKTVAVTVVTVAKPTASHCQASARVRLTVETLQDWYNSFVASQQAGFDAMAAQQGKNGIPAATDVAKVSNPDGQGTPDDPNALGSAIQAQQSGASAIQAEATGGGGQ